MATLHGPGGSPGGRLSIIETVVVPPVEWARELFMKLAIAVAGG